MDYSKVGLYKIKELLGSTVAEACCSVVAGYKTCLMQNQVTGCTCTHSINNHLHNIYSNYPFPRVFYSLIRAILLETVLHLVHGTAVLKI